MYASSMKGDDDVLGMQDRQAQISMSRVAVRAEQ